MTQSELEIAAYIAAHKIYQGLGTQPDRATQGGFRSAMIDRIADAIKETMSVHTSASSEPVASPDFVPVRQSEFPPPGLLQTRHWREMRHAFDSGGLAGTPDRPCLRCGMPDFYGNHFSPSGERLQGAVQLLVERSRMRVQSDSQ